MTTRRKTIARYIFAWADLFLDIGRLLASYVGAQHRAELDRAKAENLHLRNQVAALQVGQQSNKITEGDLKIELLNLRIKELEWSQRNKGIGSPTFKADNYAEPGDVRRGIQPPE